MWIYLTLFGVISAQTSIIIYQAKKNSKLKVEVGVLRAEILTILKASNIAKEIKGKYANLLTKIRGRSITANDLNSLLAQPRRKGTKGSARKTS